MAFSFNCSPRATLVRTVGTIKRAGPVYSLGGRASSGNGAPRASANCFPGPEIAGGQNVVEGNLPYSILSKEALLRLNPDIIILLAPELETAKAEAEKWNALGAINAVRHHRVHILTGDYTCIPGPRFIQILDDFARIIRQNDLEAE